MKLLNLNQIDEAVNLLLNGEVLAFPTETVYGLGAPIFSPESIQKIFIAKSRPSDNPLIAHVSSFQQIQEITAFLPDLFFPLYEAFFPGPLALILPKSQKVPLIATSQLQSIGVRMPNHPVALALIDQLGVPLVAPSANLSGRPSATSWEHVYEDFNGKISGVLCADPSKIGIESTVVSLLDQEPVLLRPGYITKEQIEEVLQMRIKVASKKNNEPVLSPGMKYRHYAPETPIHVFYKQEDLLAYAKKSAKRMILSPIPVEVEGLFIQLSSANLYSALRQADLLFLEEILILCTQEVRNDQGLINRIEKAAGFF